MDRSLMNAYEMQPLVVRTPRTVFPPVIPPVMPFCILHGEVEVTTEGAGHAWLAAQARPAVPHSACHLGGVLTPGQGEGGELTLARRGS